ncbi:enoyl-CoA hydratase [Streptomyces sp. SAI-135]|jgi:enoyl-CoA hydratase|uniref:crotonase/enoyl-CoA hydratase family protein n=1 Tax=unclassified Streptomyces TaxID=2593676 RepID=UPI0024771A8B|nr:MULTISPECIES: crotonase/enoyl-CoA hydratase family protein [unclassified Streptomyces]MDH6522786.1 enoyl-CoA hydratase [Streptomyces sp. SAI-090]MDH6613599.1 enoyl-CoA hydratase [Streptomyces sp. SAI-135]
MSTEGGDAEPTVMLEVRGDVLVVSINRPKVLNAIDQATAELLAHAFTRLDEDDTVRVGVLSGGPKAFSTGADLHAVAAGQSPLVPGRGFGGLTERPPRKPLLAAIEGYALGGGFEMALACDLIVASRTAQFGLPEVTRGLIASAGGLLRLPTKLPHSVAMRMALTGERLTGERMSDLHLVSELVDPGCALESAVALAARIAKNAPLSVQASKHLVNAAVDGMTDDLLGVQAELQARLLTSRDVAEGIAAFKERRPPRWQGR